MYDLGRLRCGQSADGFNFWTPNLARVEAFAARALRSPHLFVQDDLWISLYLRVGPDRPLDVAQLVELGALEDASVNRADMS